MTRSPNYLCTLWLPLFSRNMLYEREILIFIMRSRLRTGWVRTGHICPMKKNKSFYQEITRKIPKTIRLGYYTKLSSRNTLLAINLCWYKGEFQFSVMYLLKVRSRISTQSILDNALKSEGYHAFKKKHMNWLFYTCKCYHLITRIHHT